MIMLHAVDINATVRRRTRAPQSVNLWTYSCGISLFAVQYRQPSETDRICSGPRRRRRKKERESEREKESHVAHSCITFPSINVAGYPENVQARGKNKRDVSGLLA